MVWLRTEGTKLMVEGDILSLLLKFTVLRVRSYDREEELTNRLATPVVGSGSGSGVGVGLSLPPGDEFPHESMATKAQGSASRRMDDRLIRFISDVG
jgi:hypothetical protein